MKLNEIQEGIKAGKTLKELVIVEEFIPTITRKAIIEKVSEICVSLNEDGLLQYDNIDIEMWAILFKTVSLTDVDLTTIFENKEDGSLDIHGESVYEIYDTLKQIEMPYFLACELHDVIDSDVYDYILQQVTLYNSAPAVLNRALNQLLSKIPNESSLTDLISKIPDAIKNLPQLENFDLIKTAMEDSSKVVPMKTPKAKTPRGKAVNKFVEEK